MLHTFICEHPSQSLDSSFNSPPFGFLWAVCLLKADGNKNGAFKLFLFEIHVWGLGRRSRKALSLMCAFIGLDDEL